MSDSPIVVARVATERGELVLRQDGNDYEVISNGTFLMDTRGGHSEQLLIDAALQRHPAPHDVLIGGLGIGFSLVAALTDRRVAQVTVVEVEQALVDWHDTHLASFSGGLLHDARVVVVVADISTHLAARASSYDVVCLDVDNGPDWTVIEANNALYDDAGSRLVVGALRPCVTVLRAAVADPPRRPDRAHGAPRSRRARRRLRRHPPAGPVIIT